MTLRETAASRTLWLLSRANDPFVAGGIAAVLGGSFDGYWLTGFAAGLYLWHAVGLLVKCAVGVRAEDPDDVMLIIEDGNGEDEPYLPMTAMGVTFGVPLVAWHTVGIPFLPEPATAWTVDQLVAAALGGIAWFLVSTFVVMLGVMLCVDALRRLTGREGLQWFPE